jgi:hypothetical protein
LLRGTGAKERDSNDRSKQSKREEGREKMWERKKSRKKPRGKRMNEWRGLSTI